MPTRQKIAVIAIFFLGGFTTITGILRLHFLSYAYASLKAPLFNDIACMLLPSLAITSLMLLQAHYAPAFYWSIIETNTGILSACLPTLRPLAKAYPLTPSLSNLLKSLSGGFRSTLRSQSDVRLNSMEHGFSDMESKALGMHQNKAYAAYDSSKAASSDRSGIRCESRYSVSDESPYP